MTVPLLVGLDGVQKMSKSLNNYIGIDEEPNQIFGKVMSISDELMFKYYEMVTDIPMEEVKTLEEGMKDGSIHPRDIKVRLGKEICAQFYDKETAEKAEMEFNKIFVKKDIPDDMPEYKIQDEDLVDGKIWIVKLLTLTQMAKSNGEARRLIKGGGVSFDGEKITDDEFELTTPFNGVLKVGKRRFVKIL